MKLCRLNAAQHLQLMVGLLEDPSVSPSIVNIQEEQAVVHSLYS